MRKNFVTVSIAAPFSVENMCSLSPCISTSSRLHSALQLTKLRFPGGGPHVTVTVLLMNTSGGSNFKLSGPLRKQTQGSDSSELNNHTSRGNKAVSRKINTNMCKTVLLSNSTRYVSPICVSTPACNAPISVSSKEVALIEYSAIVLPLL